MRSQNLLFEKIPVFNNLGFPKRCKQKKALFPEPNSGWDCLGELTYRKDTKAQTHTNKTTTMSFVLDCLCLFVNSKRAQNEKIFS